MTNNCINLADYESDFDLLFIDFDLPNAAVFTLLDLLALKPRKIKILLFTSIYSESLTAKLTNYNMEAVIAKTAEAENLKTIISLVYNGEKFFDEKIIKRLNLNEETIKNYKQSGLTNRQIEI